MGARAVSLSLASCCLLALGCRSKQEVCEHAAEASWGMFERNPQEYPLFAVPEFDRHYGERFVDRCLNLHQLEIRCMRKVDELVAIEERLDAELAACAEASSGREACVDAAQSRASEDASGCTETFRKVVAEASIAAMDLTRR